MTKKEFGRLIAFVLVVCVMLICLSDLFELDNSKNYDRRFTTFRGLAENTLDAVWIGTSGVDRYWVAAQAYEDYGMTVYPLAVDEMPTWLFTNMLDEIYTYQNPKFVIVDARAFGQSNTDESRLDARGRRVIDAMELMSVNRFKTALKTMQVMSEHFDESYKWDPSYLLPYIKHHAKWSEDSYTLDKNWGNKEHLYMGYYMDDDLTPDAEEQEPLVYDPNAYEPLDPLAEETLYELLNYAEEKDIELLFVDTPQFKSEKEMGRANALYQILDQEGANYINFCETDEWGYFVNGLDLDPQNDFYNDGHVNFYGAQKFTDVMAAYLAENYDMEDHREDPAVQEDWDGILDKIFAKVEKWEK